SRPMLAIHSETSRAYWRVVMQRPVPRRLVKSYERFARDHSSHKCPCRKLTRCAGLSLPRATRPLRATKRIPWRIPLAPSLSVQLLSGRYGAEQSVPLAIYPVSEVKRVGIAIIAADSEIQGPQPARAAGCRDRDCPMELSIRKGEAIDLA